MNYSDSVLLKKFWLLPVITHRFWCWFIVCSITKKVISIWHLSMMAGIFDLWVYIETKFTQPTLIICPFAVDIQCMSFSPHFSLYILYLASMTLWWKPPYNQHVKRSSYLLSSSCRYHDQQRCLNSITKPVEFIISLSALTLLLSLKAIIESHLVNKWNPGKVDKRDHLFHSLMFQAFRYPGSLVWRWFFFCRVFQLAEIFYWLLMIRMEVLLVHPFSTNVKVSEKLKFLTLWHAHIRGRVMR